MAQTLKVQFPGGKKINVQAGDFLIETDQCVKAGGEASAPEPFALFLSSMAACAGIFALNFCESRKLSTQGLALDMDWERDSKAPFAAKVCYKLSLPEGFPDKYRNSIVKAIELCSVKYYINNPPEFSIEIVSD